VSRIANSRGQANVRDTLAVLSGAIEQAIRNIKQSHHP
jgi:hypothetical protein